MNGERREHTRNARNVRAWNTRNGFYFSFDALIALTVIAVAFIVVLSSQPNATKTMNSDAQSVVQADATAESAMQVALRQPLAQALPENEVQFFINNTELTAADRERPVLDAIAVLWASNETVQARNLTRQFFEVTMPDRYQYQLSLQDGERTVIYNTTNLTGDPAFVARASRLISGVSRNRPSKGYIARASLQEAVTKEEKDVFLGGYVGDGNVTVNVSLPDLDTVLNVTIEGDFASAFNLSANGYPAGVYNASSGNLTADQFHVCSTEQNASVCEQLDSGNNLFQFQFLTGNQSIGGGFIRVVFNRTTGLNEQGTRYLEEEQRIPGIDGVINLFSSFYVPGTLHDMTANIHYTANRGNVFVNIGNATVYEQDADGEETIVLDGDRILANLSDSGLSYNALSNRTVPFKIGVTRASLLKGEAGAIDAVATTDLSGSMSSQCSGGGGSQCKLEKAKNATKDFVDLILDTPDARVGLTGFNDFIKSYKPLERNRSTLKDEVDTYDGNGGTCVGCGIIRSTNTLIIHKLEKEILGSGDAWRYTTGSVDTNWTERSYDDSGWDSVATPAGDGGKAINQIGDADTYRFRKTFDFPKEDYYQPYLSIRHTGNVTVSLNNETVYRSGAGHTGNYWDSHVGRWNKKSGLWHKSSNRYVTDDSAWYFGQEEVDRYSTGERENGSLITHTLDLSNLSSPTLRYSHWLDVENKDDVYIEVNDGTGWDQLTSYQGATKQWENVSFDLSAYATETVQVRFRFEAADAKGKNDYMEGWYVDNVTVGGFDSNVLDRSLFNATNNVFAVELDATSQPFENGSMNRSTFTGDNTNTTVTADGVELDGTTAGTYLSNPIVLKDIADWTGNASGATTPDSTNITVQYGTNVSGNWQYTTNLSSVSNSKFLRFKTVFRSNSTERTPTLHWQQFEYSRYGTSFDLQLTGDEVRTPSMLVVSDGKSNQATNMDNVPDHDGDGDVDASDHAIEAACRAQDKYRADVYTIAFGGNADEDELRLAAKCGGGKFYNASIDDLVDVYEDIGLEIIEASFEGQAIFIQSGNVSHELHPDSHLSFNYTPAKQTDFGAFSLTQTTDRFGGSVESPKNGTFTVPPGVTVTEALTTSYSGRNWADRLLVQNESDRFEYVYQLWRYGEDYPELGDPFLLHIPVDLVQEGENTVQVDTALNRTQPEGGSPDNRVIYTAAVEGSVGYGNVFGSSEGGTYTFETVTGNTTITVGNASDVWNPTEDAIDNATARLVNQLDVDNDGVVDFSLDAEDLEISAQNTGGIEWLWGPATASLEVWRK